MKITRTQLIRTAKAEIAEWDLPNGLALAILFAFIHRLTTGETIEETFRTVAQSDYEI